MIVDEIIWKISSIKEEKPTAQLIVYMDNESWRNMMVELTGNMSSEGYDVYKSGGRKIMDCPVFRVLLNERVTGHGIKVAEILS
jgi:hypothetical protein